MDYHEILLLLTKFDKHITKDITDDQLKEILNTVYSCIPDTVLNDIVLNRNTVIKNNDTGWQYLHSLLYSIKTLCNTELSEENPLITVDQLRVIKTGLEVVTCIGIVPSLLSNTQTHIIKTRSRTFKLKLNDDPILEKYKILTYTIRILLECFDKSIIRIAIISQLDCLLAALLQLSHAPLIEPREQNDICNFSSSEFEMTFELYNQLKHEQEEFCQKLRKLIDNCPQALVIKEFMIILAIKNNPKWLQASIKYYLTDRIMLVNGVAALTLAICDEVSDLGKCWHKLDITARLVATSHGPNVEKYYDSICAQILEMLFLKNNKQGTAIATCCIKALYDYKPDECIKRIIHFIMDPLLVKCSIIKKHESILKTEDQITHCVENLCKLFITTDAEFKCLPTKLLSPVALPIFYLYVKSYKSIYILRNQVQQLLLKLLAEQSIREMIFSIFLNHQENNEFGQKLCFRFGANGGFEIAEEPVSIEYEELADCLFHLIEKDEHLSFNLFTYLLTVLPRLNDIADEFQEGKLLETDSDTLERIEKQIIAGKLLTLLAGSTLVQKAQIKNPKPLLDFIKFFFSKVISSFGSADKSTYEQDSSILYTSLMLIKIIITDGNIIETWKAFENFVVSIKREFNLKKCPEHIFLIVEEIETLVKNKGKVHTKNYYDLSVSNNKLSEFDKALADLADPLLPVRAHGIVALTKLIERRHPEVEVKKEFLLCLFQENLNHDDSFIYLAAINGICAMSTEFPEQVIEILVQEFIGISQKTRDHDIAPETRAKLGEILVKTTRALGEMTPKYKGLLVNGFLCGVRDSDPLVRASSLSCLGEFCKIMGFKLGNLIIEILYCIGCIIKTDKNHECRRAGVLVATLLLRGLGKDALIELGENLLTLYRGLKHLRDNDKDPVLQLHAQLALEEFDDIAQQFLFTKPRLEKSIFLLSN